MKTISRGLLLPALSILGTLIITSCPLPITEALVAAIEDDKNPVVSVSSHSNNDYYYSSLLIEGSITDDAISPGDGKGTLSRLSFFAESGFAYNGGILIDSQGNVSADPSMGGGVVTYDSSSGAFTVEMDTSGLDFNIVVRITAVDLNGNVGTRDLSLRSSNGPAVSILTPTETTYSANSTIVVSGTLSDSVELTGTIDEIDEVSFGISTVPPTVTMDVGSGAASPNYVSPGVFEMSVPQIPGTSSDEALFRLNGTAFTCSFYPPDSGMGSPRITVNAIDRNGNVGEDTIDLTLLTGGPTINVYEPARSGNFYSSVLPATMTVDFRSAVSSAAAPVSQVTVQTKDAGDTNYRSPVYDFNMGPGVGYTGTLNHDVMPLSLAGHSGDVRILITAIDTEGEDRQVTRNIADDTTGPQFDGFSFVSSIGGDQYARNGETAAMAFSLSDVGIGVDHATLAISGTGDDAGYNAVLAGAGAGPYALTFNLDGSTPVDGESRVIYTLDVQDDLGNASSVDEDDLTLYFYPAAPTSAPSITFDKTVSASPSDPSYLRGSERIRARFTPGRHLDVSASGFRFVLGGTPTSTILLAETSPGSGVYEAAYDVSGSDADGPVEWELDYVDMAGNSALYDESSTGYSTTGYTVDNTAPGIENDSIVSNYTDTTVVPSGYRGLVYFEIDESGSGTAGSAKTVDFYVDGILETTETAYDQGGGVWRARTDTIGSGFSQGSLTAVVKVYDAAGNVSPSGVPGSVEVDWQAPQFDGNPTVSSDGVVSGDSSKAGIGDTITVSITLDDPQKSGVKPVVRLDSGSAGEITVDSADVSVGADRTIWTAQYTVPDPGTNLLGTVTVEVDTRDDTDQTDSLSYTSTLTVDNQRPTHPSPSVSPSGPYDSGDTVTVSLSVDETHSSVVFHENGNDHPASWDSGNSDWRTDITLNTVGTYDITATVTDDHGNEDTDSSAQSVTVN